MRPAPASTDTPAGPGFDPPARRRIVPAVCGRCREAGEAFADQWDTGPAPRCGFCGAALKPRDGKPPRAPA